MGKGETNMDQNIQLFPFFFRNQAIMGMRKWQTCCDPPLNNPSLDDLNPFILFWNVLNARRTISLSPIFSIIKDFLVVVKQVPEVTGSKLRDMWRDVAGTGFLYPPGLVLPFGNDEPLWVFLVDTWEADTIVDFDNLGVEKCDNLAPIAGDDDLVAGEICSFLRGVII